MRPVTNIPPGMRHGDEEYEYGNAHGDPGVSFTCGRCGRFRPDYVQRASDVCWDAQGKPLCKECSVHGVGTRPLTITPDQEED